MSSLSINLVREGLSASAEKAVEIGGGRLGCISSLRHPKIHSSRVKTKVEDLGPCVGLTLWSPSWKIVAHSAPEMDRPEFVEKRILKFISDLREKIAMTKGDEEMIAFIDGGIEANTKNPLSMISSAIVDRMYEALASENVPVTVIAGQNNNSLASRINNYATGKSIFVSGNPFKDINLNATQEEIEDALRNNFDFVEISSKTPIKVIEGFTK